MQSSQWIILKCTHPKRLSGNSVWPFQIITRVRGKFFNFPSFLFSLPFLPPLQPRPLAKNVFCSSVSQIKYPIQPYFLFAGWLLVARFAFKDFPSHNVYQFLSCPTMSIEVSKWVNNIFLTKTEHKNKINASLNNLRLVKVKINLNRLSNGIKVKLEMQVYLIYVRFI